MLAVAAGLLLPAFALPLAAADAAGPSWHWTKPYTIPGKIDSINGLSCPSLSLCVAVSSNKLLWTTKPTAGASHWKNVALEPSSQPDVQGGVILDDVSCPTTTFCAAVDDIGNVFTTTHPTGGKAQWHKRQVDNIEMLTIDCASATMCAALDYYGNALTSSNPAAGPWSSVKISATNGAAYYSVSCPSKSLCAAVESDGKIAYTTSPGAAAPTWHIAKVGGPGWMAIACATAAHCVATGSGGVIGVSNNPAGGVKTWHRTTVHPASFGLSKVDCPTPSFCMAVGANDWFSTSPAAKASHWHQATVASGSQTAVSCPTAKHCFVGTATTEFIRGARS